MLIAEVLRHRRCPITRGIPSHRDSRRFALEGARDRLDVPARVHHWFIRLAWTVSDPAGSDTIDPEHIGEAIQLRCLNHPG